MAPGPNPHARIQSLELGGISPTNARRRRYDLDPARQLRPQHVQDLQGCAPFVRRGVGQQVRVQHDEGVAEAPQQVVEDRDPVAQVGGVPELLHGHGERGLEQAVGADLHGLQHQHADEVRAAYGLLPVICVAQGPDDGQAAVEDEVDQVDHEVLRDDGHAGVDEKQRGVRLGSPRVQFLDVGEGQLRALSASVPDGPAESQGISRGWEGAPEWQGEHLGEVDSI